MYSSHSSGRAFTVPGKAHAPTGPDAELIGLCNLFIANETERHLLFEHDHCAMDYGPNRPRYQELIADQDRTIGLVEKCRPPSTHAGQVAIACATKTWFDPDEIGDDVPERMLIQLVAGLTQDFTWPPRPGSCDTSRWLPPTSPKEVEEHAAEQRAWLASMVAEFAERLASRGLIA